MGGAGGAVGRAAGARPRSRGLDADTPTDRDRLHRGIVAGDAASALIAAARAGVRRAGVGRASVGGAARAETADPVLGLGDRRAPVHHGPGELEHRVAVPRFLLEPTREAAALDVLED